MAAVAGRGLTAGCALATSACVAPASELGRGCPCQEPFVCCEPAQVCVARGDMCGATDAGPEVSAPQPAAVASALACATDDASSSLELIDPMQPDDVPLERRAVWAPFGDDTDGGVVTAEIAPLDVPRCDSAFAMHLRATGFSIWGASLGLVPNAVADDSAAGGHAEAFDARAYAGVHFWARSGSDRPITMRLDVQDRHTDPAGGVCDPNPDAADRCYKPFMQLLAATAVWQPFSVRFGDLSQMPTWPGYQSPDGLALDAIYGINWTILSSQAAVSADVWIDDVAWIRGDVPSP